MDCGYLLEEHGVKERIQTAKVTWLAQVAIRRWTGGKEGKRRTERMEKEWEWEGRKFNKCWSNQIKTTGLSLNSPAFWCLSPSSYSSSLVKASSQEFVDGVLVISKTCLQQGLWVSLLSVVGVLPRNQRSKTLLRSHQHRHRGIFINIISLQGWEWVREVPESTSPQSVLLPNVLVLSICNNWVITSKVVL